MDESCRSTMINVAQAQIVFTLIATMQRGSASGLAAARARYPAIEAARREQ